MSALARVGGAEGRMRTCGRSEMSQSSTSERMMPPCERAMMTTFFCVGQSNTLRAFEYSSGVASWVPYTHRKRRCTGGQRCGSIRETKNFDRPLVAADTRSVQRESRWSGCGPRAPCD